MKCRTACSSFCWAWKCWRFHFNGYFSVPASPRLSSCLRFGWRWWPWCLLAFGGQGQARESSVVLLTWGGLHGGLSLALALALPLTDGRTWILATTYIVVVFSMVLQGGSLGMFLRRFKPAETHPPIEQPQEL